MIATNNLRKSFGKFDALKGISLNVKENEVYGFLGHNGAGKSTTIEILAGITKATEGNVKLGYPGYEGIGYLPEEPKFYPWMTGYEYLNYIGSGFGKNQKKRVDEMLDWVGLKGASKRRIGGYSRGMRQRLGMAVALFYDPSIILLDEPSSALDPEGRSDVLKMIKELQERGKTVFLSTHILDDVEKVCNSVGIIREGTLIKEDSLNNIISQYTEPNFELSLAEEPSPYEIINISKEHWIKEVHKGNNKISITADEQDCCENRIFELASKMKTPVNSLVKKTHTLEEIYMMITEEES